MNRLRIPAAGIVLLLLAGAGALQAQSITVEKGKIEISKGKVESKGDVIIAGTLTPSLVLSDGSTLSLGTSAELRIGDSSNSGTLSSTTSTTAPVITTLGTAGTDFFTVTVGANGTLTVSSLDIRSVDANGLTLSDGSTITGNTISGLTFDYIESNGTCLRILHPSGLFTVSNSQFNDSGSTTPRNISTVTGFTGNVDASTGASGYWSTGPASAHEDDHGSGTDDSITSTIQWAGTTPYIRRVYSTSPDATYLAGGDINVTVDFTKPVTLSGGNLVVDLDSGGQAIIVPFSSAMSASAIYTVSVGDNSLDLAAITPLTLSAGTLQDASGNTADLAVPTGKNIHDSSDIVVDAVSPDATAAVVNDGPAADIDFQGSTTVIRANWSGFTDTSPIADYKWSVLVQGGATVMAFQSVGTNLSASASLSLSPGTTYAIQVRAFDAAGNYGEVESDGVMVDTGVPSMPSGGTSVSAPPGVTLDWSDSTDPEGSTVIYRLQIATDVNFAEIIFDDLLSQSQFTTGTLPPGTYYWRIIAIDEAGNESFVSATWMFIVTGSGAGFLGVMTGTNSPADSEERNDAAGLSLLQLRFQAGPSAAVPVSSVSLTANGTADESTSIGAVYLYLDVDRNGLLDLTTDLQLAGPETFSSNDGTITFSLNREIPAGLTRDWIVVADLNGTASVGETVALQLSSTGASVSATSSSTISGRTARIVSATSPGAVTVKKETATLPAGGVAAPETNVEMLQIQVSTSSVEEITVTGLRVFPSGTGNEATDVTQVRLVLDADGNGIFDPATDLTVLATDPLAVDDTAVTLTINRTIAVGTSEKWLLLYDFSGTASAGATFAIEVRPEVPGGVTVSGAISALDLLPLGNTATGNTQTVGTFGVDAGRLTVTHVPAPASGSIEPSTLNVRVLGFDLTAGGLEAVDVTQVQVGSLGSGNESADISGITLWEDDGDGTFTFGNETVVATAQGPFAQNNGTALFPGFSLQIGAGITKRWFVTFDFKAPVAGGTTYQAWLDLEESPSPFSSSGATTLATVTPAGGLVIGGEVTIQAAPTPPPSGGGGGGGGGCGYSGEGNGPPGLPVLLLLLIFVLRRRGAGA